MNSINYTSQSCLFFQNYICKINKQIKSSDQTMLLVRKYKLTSNQCPSWQAPITYYEGSSELGGRKANAPPEFCQNVYKCSLAKDLG